MSDTKPKVISISGGPVPETGEPRDDVIEILEEMLERARSGDVVGMAIAVMHSDKTASWRASGCVGSYSMIGAFRRAEHELLAGDES